MHCQSPIKLFRQTMEKSCLALEWSVDGRAVLQLMVPSASARDDPDLARDEDRNNVFRFEGDTDPPKRCPFAAHIRKTNPRADLDPFGGTTEKRILRRGIPFGVDFTPGQEASNTDKPKRGLLFVCYQSVLRNGSRFIQNCKFPSPILSLPYSISLSLAASHTSSWQLPPPFLLA